MDPDSDKTTLENQISKAAQQLVENFDYSLEDLVQIVREAFGEAT